MKGECETLSLPSVETFFPLENGIVFYLDAEFVVFLDMEFLTDNFGIWRKEEGPAASACLAILIILRIVGSLKVS